MLCNQLKAADKKCGEKKPRYNDTIKGKEKDNWQVFPVRVGPLYVIDSIYFFFYLLSLYFSFLLYLCRRMARTLSKSLLQNKTIPPPK